MAYCHPYAIIFCDACCEPIEDAPAGGGLYVFARGGESVYEEPPLCPQCSLAIGVNAMVRWAEEEEEG